MTVIDVRLRDFVLRLYDLLVREEFEALEQLAGGIRLGADELKRAVEEYPFRLKPWPLDSAIPMDIVRIKGRNPPAWSVVMAGYTAEEGRSDLSLELTLTKSGDDFKVEFDDLHVL